MLNKQVKVVGKRQMKVETVELPKTNGAAVIKVIQTGICGSDAHFWNSGDTLGKDTVIGHEFIGVVEDPGTNEELKAGDRVLALPRNGESGFEDPCGRCEACLAGDFEHCSARVIKYAMGGSPDSAGSFSEHLIWYPHSVYKIPDSLDNESAMLVEPFTTSLHAVDMVDMKPGAKVLILGGGVIACGIAEYCRIYGAEQIVMTELNKEKIKTIRSWNLVDEVFDAGDPDVYKKIAEIAPEGGFDYVYDVVVRRDSLKQGMALVKRFGTCVVVGMNFKDDIPVNAFDLVMWNKYVIGCKGIHVGEFKASMRHIAEGRINAKKYVTRHEKLENAQEVFENMEKDTNYFKIVLDVE